MKLEKILFLDVETVSQTELYSELNEEMAFLWNEKYQQIKKRAPEKYEEESDAISSYQDTGLFAEFGKIACISFGYIYMEEETYFLKIKSLYGTDERKILSDFALILHNLTGKNYRLCGHNAKEFDIPYIARRMIINNIELPPILLSTRGKQWESPVIDTMEMWKFGDYKHYTSLKLLCNTLDIPSPKEDMEGNDVYRVYYQEQNLERIAHYCENDVIATVQIYQKLTGKPLIGMENIVKCTSIEGV